LPTPLRLIHAPPPTTPCHTPSDSPPRDISSEQLNQTSAEGPRRRRRPHVDLKPALRPVRATQLQTRPVDRSRPTQRPHSPQRPGTASTCNASRTTFRHAQALHHVFSTGKRDFSTHPEPPITHARQNPLKPERSAPIEPTSREKQCRRPPSLQSSASSSTLAASIAQSQAFQTKIAGVLRHGKTPRGRRPNPE